MKYPILLIPKELDNIKNSNIEIPSSIAKPDQPLRDNKKYQSWILIIFSLFIVISGGSNNSDTTVIIGLGILLIAIIWRLIESNGNEIIEEKFKTMQLDYQENLKLFKEREKERDYIRNISKDQNKSKQYLSDQKRLFFTNIAKPDYFNKAKKGITEDYFKEFLEEYFTNEIYTDVTINQKGMYGFPFTPDFVLCNSSEGFCIDIEINEPYTSDNRKPIHFVINEEKTIDYIRDEFFLNNNWPIIKFSEEQIIKNPIGCCYYIAETILLLFSNSKYLLKFKNVPPLLHIVAWDYDEALRKSKEKFREKLLLEIGINLHPSVQEKKAIYDIDELPF